MAHSASTNPPQSRHAGTEEPSIGTLVQSAMADVSTLIRSEVELAKAEMTSSAKKAGIGAGAFGAAGVVLAFSVFFIGIALAEFLTWLGLIRWISYLIVWALFVVVAAIAALIGRRQIKKIDKPERTLETLRELPSVMHREAPGARRREVPTVTNGRVQLRGSDNYTV
ncbi:phage holin family protein [Geodermatophilus marinus]|uniref:phage holin family protein n=1 Tax=Geodermatophilus sp. LHW52908 TaxID=2303986 RepID=UPI000E3C7AD3|nr:phage holin family protein [Geodermatophilus sp. LHW52908]RFU22291.1 phage holin family protein [Geodermatophilus sp. LHW52908]